MLVMRLPRVVPVGMRSNNIACMHRWAGSQVSRVTAIKVSPFAGTVEDLPSKCCELADVCLAHLALWFRLNA